MSEDSLEDPWEDVEPSARAAYFERFEEAMTHLAPGMPAPPQRAPPAEERERRLASAISAHAPGHGWTVPPQADWPEPPAYCAACMTVPQLAVLKGLPEYLRHLNVSRDLDDLQAPPAPLEEARADLQRRLHRPPDGSTEAHGLRFDVWRLDGGERFFAAYAWKPASAGVEAAPYLLFFACSCP